MFYQVNLTGSGLFKKIGLVQILVINLMKNAKNIFLLLKELKNTESAQSRKL